MVLSCIVASLLANIQTHYIHGSKDSLGRALSIGIDFVRVITYCANFCRSLIASLVQDT